MKNNNIKIIINIILCISILSLTACFNQKEQIEIDNNIENYLQENKKEESYENIVSNTVQYGEESNNKDIEKKEQRKNETIIKARDCFHNVGFVEKLCEQQGTYYFERNREENEEYEMFDWYVYIFNERQVYKNIKQNNEPILTNEGKLEIKKGQYIYILCSYNPDTQVLPSTSSQSYTYYMK